MSGSAAKANQGKLYEILAGKSAPAVGGKAHFEGDLAFAKMAGAKSMADIFGHAERLGDNGSVGRSLNFGSKRDCGHMPVEVRARLFDLKKMVNNVEIQASAMFKTAMPTPDMMMATPLYKHILEPMLKAYNVTDFSTWIPQVNARFYFAEFELALMVADLFDQLPMESATVYVPGALGRLFGKLEVDTASFSPQYNSQSGYTVTAKDNVVHTEITQDLNEDAAPAIIDKLRYEVVAGVGRSEERAILDGDDSGSHMDSDVSASTDFRKAFKGLRKRGLDNSASNVVVDHAGDQPSKALFANLLKALGRFATDKADLQWIMGSSVSNALVTGAIPELFTANVFGGPASNRTGAVPQVFGIVPVESEWVREDLDATGVYSGAAQTKSWMALVKKSRFQRHVRTPIRVWAAPYLPSSDKMLMTAKKRHTFGGVPQTSTETSLAIAIGIETHT